VLLEEALDEETAGRWEPAVMTPVTVLLGQFVEVTVTVVMITPSMDSVMLGAPELDLALMVSAVDSGNITVPETVAPSLRASAYRPEALGSRTVLAGLAGATVMDSNWTVVTGIGAWVVVTADLAAAPREIRLAVSAVSLRAAPAITASAASR
jgi:hypothetical protein